MSLLFELGFGVPFLVLHTVITSQNCSFWPEILFYIGDCCPPSPLNLNLREDILFYIGSCCLLSPPLQSQPLEGHPILHRKHIPPLPRSKIQPFSFLPQTDRTLRWLFGRGGRRWRRARRYCPPGREVWSCYISGSVIYILYAYSMSTAILLIKARGMALLYLL